MRIRIIDAFTDEPFRGNPAGVCLLPGGDWPAEDWMQRVAAEMNLSETAFAKLRPETEPQPRPENSAESAAGAEPSVVGEWDLRWFTPLTEVAMCGHATLATAHALAEDGHPAGPVRFHTL